MLVVSNNQKINGDGNYQAGRDINININGDNAIQFYEDDLKELICSFSDIVENLEPNDLNDFYSPEIEVKNKINNLSDSYFQYMKENSLPYFYQIKTFLQDVKNKDIQELYGRIANELNYKIAIFKNDFESFDKILNALYDYVINKKDSKFNEKRNLLIIFLNFMYWNCDIGEKYDKTK